MFDYWSRVSFGIRTAVLITVTMAFPRGLGSEDAGLQRGSLAPGAREEGLAGTKAEGQRAGTVDGSEIRRSPPGMYKTL